MAILTDENFIIVLNRKNEILKSIQKNLNKGSKYRFKVDMLNNSRNNTFELVVTNKGVSFHVPLNIDLNAITEKPLVWTRCNYSVYTYGTDITDEISEMIVYLTKAFVGTKLLF